jgi:hypothetical protein
MIIEQPGGRVDPIDNITEMEFEQAGYDDAMEKRKANFTLIFQERPFWAYSAYMRGYHTATYILESRIPK